MKTTKRSLLTTAVCLLLTAVMLLGSTFAWFTDSVTNTGNEIQSGTLNIELNDGSKNVLFTSENFLWEPGRSQDAAVSIKNVGSLWLKYIVSFDNVVTSGNADITEVLDVYKAEANATSLEGAKKLGTVKELMAAGQLEEAGILAPEGEGTSSEAFTLVIKMQESAGNQYQDCSVTFDVVVSATQTPHEEDGFGNPNYDQDAIFDQVDVSYDSSLSAQENGAHLQEVIATAEEGATIVVGPGEYDIPRDEATSVEGQTGWYFAITADNVTVIGAPGAVLTSTVKSENGAWASQNMVSIFGDNVTFQGFTIISKEEVNKAIEVRGENSIIRDVTIQCADHTPGFGGSIYYSGNVGNAKLENVTVEKAWVSTTAVTGGTITVSNVNLNFAGCEYGGSPISANAKDVLKVTDSFVLTVDNTTDLDELMTQVPEGTTVKLASDFTVTTPASKNQVAVDIVTDGVTLDGNGHKITASEDGNNQSHVLGVTGAENVTIKNLTVTADGKMAKHGINVYESFGVTVSNVSVSNMSGLGLMINGSHVTITDSFTLSGNGWGNGINVGFGSSMNNGGKGSLLDATQANLTGVDSAYADVNDVTNASGKGGITIRMPAGYEKNEIGGGIYWNKSAE